MRIVLGDTGRAKRSEHDELPDHVLVKLAKFALLGRANSTD
jgi:hypothetical protein